jgi:hypothetical protein
LPFFLLFFNVSGGQNGARKRDCLGSYVTLAEARRSPIAGWIKKL